MTQKLKRIGAVSLALTLVLSGCGKKGTSNSDKSSSGSSSQTSSAASASAPGSSSSSDTSQIGYTAVDMDSADAVWSDLDSYKGKGLDMMLVVLDEPFFQDGYNTFSAYLNTGDNYGFDFRVEVRDTSLADLEPDDIIQIQGRVTGSAPTEAEFGMYSKQMVMTADSIQILQHTEKDPEDVVFQITESDTNEYSDVSIKVDEVTVSDAETRVHFTIQNDSKNSESFTLDPFGSCIWQGNNVAQYQYNGDASDPNVEFIVEAGESSSGALCFGPLEKKDMKIELRGWYGNSDSSDSQWTFDVKAVDKAEVEQ